MAAGYTTEEVPTCRGGQGEKWRAWQATGRSTPNQPSPQGKETLFRALDLQNHRSMEDPCRNGTKSIQLHLVLLHMQLFNVAKESGIVSLVQPKETCLGIVTVDEQKKS